MAMQYTEHKNTFIQTSDHYYLFQVIYLFIGKDYPSYELLHMLIISIRKTGQ